MVSRGPNLRRHNDRNDSKLEYVNETKTDWHAASEVLM